MPNKLIDMIQKIHKGTWSDKSYETLRMIAENPDGKWAHYTQRLIRENDPYILKTFLTNVAGDVEPCVFIHYSSANIRDKSFLECLQQPLFKLYRKGQPFNGNHLRPCPMLENPELLPKMVAQNGAHSTDLEAPESAEHLCEKCKAYADCWKPKAEKLWAEENHH